MNMKINSNLIIQERKLRAWSQQHLADVSGLNLRTIQRIETSSSASPESIKAIAASFNLEPKVFLLNVNESRSHFSITATKLITSIFVAFVSIFYFSYSFAEPVMLDVKIESNGSELADASLLNKEGKESEISLENQLKILMVSEITPENQIRLKVEIFEFSANEKYILIAKPILLTQNNKVASIVISDNQGLEYSIDITPHI